jgi:hypothetical protein
MKKVVAERATVEIEARTDVETYRVVTRQGAYLGTKIRSDVRVSMCKRASNLQLRVMAA